MANPTGWKPSMEKESSAPASSEVGAGGATRGLAYEERLLFEYPAGARSGHTVDSNTTPSKPSVSW